MQWLVSDARPNDSLFFHCRFGPLKLVQQALNSCPDSGHGGQTKDLNGDEGDGFDEGYSQFPLADLFCSQKTSLPVIYPVDFKKTSFIVDDVS